MSEDRWRPNATVATVVVDDRQRFLLVEERDPESGRLVLNQPAGHLEARETLEQAACREVLEESAWEVRLGGVLGIALYTPPGSATTFLRCTFAATPLRHHPRRPLDSPILALHWLDRGELEAESARLRSPLVLDSVDRYLAGAIYPLELIRYP